MSCPQCQGIEEQFDRRSVAKELAQYHVPGEVETIIRAAGLRRRFARHTFFWQVAVYGR